MSNTANASLSQIQKAEDDAQKMVKQAQAARDEKVSKKQAELQKAYTAAEDEARESAKMDIAQYKNEASDQGKQIVHEARAEADRLKSSLDAKTAAAVARGIEVLNTSLGIKA